MTVLVSGFTVICMTLVAGKERPELLELPDELPVFGAALDPPDVLLVEDAPAGSGKYPFTITVTVNISDAGSLN